MFEFYGTLILVEKIFFYCAAFGGMLFAVRLMLMLVGGHGGDFDASGADAIHGTADFSHGGDSDVSFKVLTLQGVSAFFMMFGLVGLCVSKMLPRQPEALQVVSIAAGTAAGVFTAWIIAKLFSMMMKLQSDGSLHIENAVGQQGTVYLNIPAEGTGKIQIAIQGSLRVCEAVSAKKEAIKSGTPVTVTAVFSGSTLAVEKL